MGGRSTVVDILYFYVITFSLSSLWISVSVSVDPNGKVIELDESNFESVISSSNYVFVDFYAPWCGHCRRLSPQLDKVAAILAESKQPILIAKLDADKFRHLADKYQINGFPTLKLFNHGGPAVDYYGPRNPDQIVQFLTKSATPDVAVLTSDSAITEFVQSADTHFPIFIGFGMNESTLSRIAIKFKNKAWFSIANDFSENVMESLDLAKLPALISLHLTYDERNVFYGPFDDQFLEEFVKQNLLPLCLPINSDTASLLRDEERKLVLTLMEDEHTEKSKQLIKLLKAAASANRDYQFAYVGFKQFRSFVVSFNVSNTTELPKMVVWDGDEEYFTVIGSERIREEDQGLEITRFLEGYKRGRTLVRKISDGESFMEFLGSLIGLKFLLFVAFLVVFVMAILVTFYIIDKNHSSGQETRPIIHEVNREKLGKKIN